MGRVLLTIGPLDSARRTTWFSWFLRKVAAAIFGNVRSVGTLFGVRRSSALLRIGVVKTSR